MKTSPNQAKSKSCTGERQFDDLLFTGRMPMADETPPKLTKKQAAHAANGKLAVALVVGGITFAISFVVCSIFINNGMISALISTSFFLPVFYGIMKMQDHHFMNVDFGYNQIDHNKDEINARDAGEREPYQNMGHPLYDFYNGESNHNYKSDPVTDSGNPEYGQCCGRMLDR